MTTVETRTREVRVERAGPVVTLVLDRPQARNALSVELMTEIERELAAVAADRTIKVVILGATGNAFSSGHDLKQMRACRDRSVYEELFDQCSRMMMSIVRLPQPVIARVQGVATAAGCQLVASCDLAVAADIGALRHTRRQHRPLLLDADGRAVAQRRRASTRWRCC